MDNDNSAELELTEQRAEEFVNKACELIREYTNRLLQKQADWAKLRDRFYHASSVTERQSLKKRIQHEHMAFLQSQMPYEKLVRKSSQWLEHGKAARPHLQLELEVRLADIEGMLHEMNFANNDID